MSTFILFLTLVVLCYYAWCTKVLAQQQIESNKFSALTSIHERMARGRTKRLSLHNYFRERLVNAVKSVLGTEFVGPQGVDMGRLVACPKLPSDVRTFNNQLDQKEMVKPALPAGGMPTYDNALETVESVLTDFDIIALPFWEGIPAATTTLKAYGNVIENTAPLVLPFVLIQMRLRDDPEYKKHYVFMLKRLGVLEKMGVDLSPLGIPEPKRETSWWRRVFP